MDINDIAARLPNVTDAEKAYLISNNPYALAAFMIDNNPGSVNLALRKMGYSHLTFDPDKKALARQLDIFIERNNAEDFDNVFRSFNIMGDKLSPTFLKELLNQFNS